MTSRILALLVAVGILAATAPLGAGQAQDGPQFRVRIETSNLDALRQYLESTGYDVLGTDPTNSTLDVAVSRAELNGLYAAACPSSPSNAGARSSHAGWTGSRAESERLSVTAAAVSAGYLNLDGIVARLNAIAAAYPAIAQVVDVTATYNTPPTFEGRHIFALKISDNVSLDEDEPAMLIAATHHAREISTPVIAPRSGRPPDGGIRRPTPASPPRSTGTRSGLRRCGIPTATTTSSPPTTSGGRTAASSRMASASTRTGTTRRHGARRAPAAPASARRPTRAPRPRRRRKPAR